MYCNKQGHDTNECWKLKREQEAQGAASAGPLQPPLSIKPPQISPAPLPCHNGMIRLFNVFSTTLSRASLIAGNRLLTACPVEGDEFPAMVRTHPSREVLTRRPTPMLVALNATPYPLKGAQKGIADAFHRVRWHKNGECTQRAPTDAHKGR